MSRLITAPREHTYASAKDLTPRNLPSLLCTEALVPVQALRWTVAGHTTLPKSLCYQKPNWPSQGILKSKAKRISKSTSLSERMKLTVMESEGTSSQQLVRPQSR